MSRLRSRLLPRRDLKVKKVFRDTDEYNYPIEGEKVDYLYSCTVHPADSSSVGLSEEGFRNKRCFKIISRGDVTALAEGDTNYFLVEAMPNVWCSIVKDNIWTNSVQNHTVLFVIETNER